MQNILTPQQHEILESERDVFSRLESIAVRLESPAAERELLARTRLQLDEFFLLVVVGEFNSGKSAFINALLGQRFLDEGVTPTTSQIHVLTYGPRPAAEQVEPFMLRVSYPVDWLREINIVDTPGTNAIIQRHQEITEAFVPRADLILFITSTDRPFSESERVFMQLVRDWGKKVVIVINKIDIMEDEASINQVVDFVRDQAAGVLGAVPRIFPVSVRLAQRARMAGTDGAGAESARWMAASRFAELETFILQALDQQQRLHLKLESPLGVAERLQGAYMGLVRQRLDLLDEDFSTLQHIDGQLDAYAADMRHDFRFRLSRIENILQDLRLRGDRFFEETIRMGRIFDLLNSARLRAEFEQQVVADTHERIEAEVNDLIDWMIERNFRQWQDITQYLNRRAAQYGDRVLGEIGGSFDINRKQLLQSVGRAAREVVATYDHQAEARELSDSVRNSLTTMGAVEIGALGIGAILLHTLTRALDPLGVIAAGTVAIAGLFVLPARRRRAKEDLDAKIEDVRQRLLETMSQQFERELARSLQEIREAIAPYTRFIRVEHQRLAEIDGQLGKVDLSLRDVRSRLHALAGDTVTR